MSYSSPSVLPPTTNDISSSQRSHLIRSARKLGSIFGTTPHLVEDIDCSSDDTASIRSSSSRSSSSKRSMFNNNKKHTPPGLFLHPNALPIRHHGDAASLILSPSPTTAEFTLSPSPEGPPNHRRRQLAKVSRTLGENIPPEVLFGYPPAQYSGSSSVTIDASQRRRGKSISYISTGSGSGASSTATSRRPSIDLSGAVPRDMPFYHSRASRGEPVNYDDYIPSKREEREWEGAWNRESMGEVRSQLRALKA